MVYPDLHLCKYLNTAITAHCILQQEKNNRVKLQQIEKKNVNMSLYNYLIEKI